MYCYANENLNSMFIKKLGLKNFRNFKDLQLSFNSNINIFIGNNGQGKTNLVESIYSVSKGKSFRTTNSEYLINEENKEFGAKVEVALQKKEIEFLLSAQFLETKKILKVNEKSSNSLKNFKLMPVIIFSPESLEVIKGMPEERRNLIDETSILENDLQIEIISEFKKLLKTKNNVLKKFKSLEMSRSQAFDLLKSLQFLFLDRSCELIQARYRTIKEITPYFRDIFHQITGQNVDISVGYVAKEQEEPKSVEEICNTLRKNSENGLEKEMNSGLCLYGPHKHDIVIYFENKDSRYYCSQGQQRALILAFKFTQILYHKLIYGYYPILILDDVLSELDSEKRAYLINFLNNNEAQTFLTTTDLDLTKNVEKEVVVMDVTSGVIKDRWS